MSDHERAWREGVEAALTVVKPTECKAADSWEAGYMAAERVHTAQIRALAYPGDAQQGNDQRERALMNGLLLAIRWIEHYGAVNDPNMQTLLPELRGLLSPHQTASEQASPRAAPAMEGTENEPSLPAPLAARSAVEEVEREWYVGNSVTRKEVALRHARRLDALERAMKEINQRAGSARVEGVIMAIQQRAAQIEKESGNG